MKTGTERMERLGLGGQKCIDERHCGREGDLWRCSVVTSLP